MDLPAARAPVAGYHPSKVGLEGRRYRIGHPPARHLLGRAGERKPNGAGLVLDYSAWPRKTVSVGPLVGKSGTLSVWKLSITGADARDHIILAGLTDDGAPIDRNTAMRLFYSPSRKVGDNGLEIPEAIRRGIDARREAVMRELAERQAPWFDEEMDKPDNRTEDKRAGSKDLDDRIKELKRQMRRTGNLPDKPALRKKARKPEQKRDEAWCDYDAAARRVEARKDTLLDQVEERSRQQVSDREPFTFKTV